MEHSSPRGTRDRVARFAGVLRAQGIARADGVILDMLMVPKAMTAGGMDS